jgi:hypothetical protein
MAEAEIVRLVNLATWSITFEFGDIEQLPGRLQKS